jgi:hypothetical protein
MSLRLVYLMRHRPDRLNWPAIVFGAYSIVFAFNTVVWAFPIFTNWLRG